MRRRLAATLAAATLALGAAAAHAQCPDRAPVDCGYGCCAATCCGVGCCDDPSAPYCCGDYCSFDPSCTSSTDGATSGGEVSAGAGPTGGGTPVCPPGYPVQCGSSHCVPADWVCCASIGYEDRMCPPFSACVCNATGCPSCDRGGGVVDDADDATSRSSRDGADDARNPYDEGPERSCAAAPSGRAPAWVSLVVVIVLGLLRRRGRRRRRRVSPSTSVGA